MKNKKASSVKSKITPSTSLNKKDEEREKNKGKYIKGNFSFLFNIE